MFQNLLISIKKFLKNRTCKIIFEPGRSIIGNTGILISKVIYIKKGYKKNFVILDAAMNDLIRPALYGAKHRIIPVKKIIQNLIKFMSLLDQYVKVQINS